MQEGDKKDAFDLFFDGALDGALDSVIEGAPEGISAGKAMSEVRDLYKNIKKEHLSCTSQYTRVQKI